MSSMPLRSLLSGSLIYGLGGAFSKLIPLLLLPLYTAQLAPADYGVVSLLQLSGTFLSSVFTFGFGTSIGVLYFPERDKFQRNRIIASAFWVLMLSGIAITTTVLIFSDLISLLLFHSAAYTTHVIWAGGAIGLSIVALPLQLQLQFSEKPSHFVAASIACVLVTAVVGVTSVVIEKIGALGLVLAWVAGQLALASLLGMYNRSILRLAFVPEVVRALFRSGWPMIPSFLFLFVIQEGVRYPLQWISGLDAVGIYAVGASLGLSLGVLTNAFISAWTPFALSYSNDTTNAPGVLGRVTFAYIVIFGLAVIAATYFAYPVVYLLVSPHFYGAAPIVGLCAGASYLSALFLMLLPPAYFAKEPQCVTGVQALSALAAGLWALVLIPKFNAVGAGLVVALASASMVSFQYLWNTVVRREAYLRIAYPRMKIAGFMLFMLVTGGLSRPLMLTFPGLEWLVACVAVLVAITIGMAAFFNRQDMLILKRLLFSRQQK